MKSLLTPAQVGERLGVNRDTARRYMRSGMTCVVLPGGDLRVEESELETWTREHRAAPISTDTARKPRKTRTTNNVLPLDLFEPDGRLKRRRRA